MTFSGAARVAGVAGWPVKHSRSPRIHNYWLKKYGIDGIYVPFAVSPDTAEQAFRSLPSLGLCGMNVTVPNKEAAYRAMDEVDLMAERMQAVNTIVVGEDGRLSGSNTDAFGFLVSLQESRPDWSASGGPAVILGAGGAARAIVAGLIDAGVPEIRIGNRTAERAEAIRDVFGGPVSCVDWGERSDALNGASLLVNTTILGMNGGSRLEIDLSALPVAAVVCDIVYVPLETPLLAAARARGNPAVDGLGMLLHQARPGFRAWFGTDPEVDERLRNYVLADL